MTVFIPVSSMSAARPPHPWLPFIFSFALFMQLLDSMILNNALPTIGKSFAVAPFDMQWVVLAYTLTVAVFLPISGFLADRWGTRPIFLVAVAVFCLGSLLCACASFFVALVLARVIQGLGGAMMVPVARLVLTKAYPREKLLGIMNVAAAPALIAPVVAPLLGGYLVEYASWHWIFLINLPIGALGGYFGLRVMPDYRVAGAHLDLGGFLLLAAAASSLTLSLAFSARPHAGMFSLVLGSFAMLAIVLYVRHARTVAHPLFSLSLFLVRTFRIGIVGNLFTRLGISAVPLLMPLFFQLVYQFSPIEAGWMLVPLALGMLAVRPLVVAIIRRFSYRGVLVVNTAFIGGVLIGFACLYGRAPALTFLPIMFLLGACSTLQFTVMNTLTIIDLRPGQKSGGNTLLVVNQQLAISMGIASGVAILDGFRGGLGLAIGSAFQATFATLGAITILFGGYFFRLDRHDGEGVY